MALPNSHSLRHAKIAAAFSADLALDPNIFAAFYAQARRKFFLEALNFFLEAEEYRYLPQLLRVPKEKRIVDEYLKKNAKQQINIEGEVHRKVMSRQGLGRAELFDEAQLASAAIIAAEPWQEFKDSQEYKIALGLKKCKPILTQVTFYDMSLHNGSSLHYHSPIVIEDKLFSEVVDDEVVSSALFFFFREKPINLPDTDIKYLPTLNAWIADAQSQDCTRSIIEALSIDFDFIALKGYFALISHRPASCLAFAKAVFNEDTIDQIQELSIEEPTAVLLSSNKVASVAGRLFWNVFTREWVHKNLGKVFSGAFVNEPPDGVLSHDKFESPMYLLASIVTDTVLSHFGSLPFEFRALIFAGYLAAKNSLKYASDEKVIQKFTLKVLVEWLCDILSNPRNYVSDFSCQGIGIRKQMNFVQSLFRSLVDNTSLNGSATIGKDQTIFDRYRTSYATRLHNEINLNDDLKFDLMSVAYYLLNLGEDLRSLSSRNNRGLPGILFKFLSRNNAIRLNSEEKELLSSSLISRFDSAKTPEKHTFPYLHPKCNHQYSTFLTLKLTSTPSVSDYLNDGLRREHKRSRSTDSRSPRNSSHSNRTKTSTDDSSDSDGDGEKLFKAEVTQESLLEQMKGAGPSDKRETKYLTLNKDRQDGTIVVVGGSVGGVLVAKGLAKTKKFRVILIDENDIFEMTQPLQDHIFNSSKSRVQKVHQEFKVPFTQVFANSGVLVVKGTVKEIAVDKVILDDMTLMFDYLVVIPEYVHRNPLPPPLAASLNLLHSRSEVEAATKCLVIGGGINAVELAASLVSDFVPPKIVTLVHDDIGLIPQINADVDEFIRQWLLEHGVILEFGEDVAVLRKSENPVSLKASNKGIEKMKHDEVQLVLSYSRRPLQADKVFHCVNVPNTSFLRTFFGDCLSEDGHVLVNQYLQVYSPTSKVIHQHIFALGDAVQFAGTQDAKLEYMAVLRQALHVIEQIGIMVEPVKKLDVLNAGKKNLKPYKPIDLEKRRVIRLGLKDAVATYYGALFDKGEAALEIREQNFQFIKKKVLEEVKSEKKTSIIAVAGAGAAELKNLPFKTVIMGTTFTGRGAAKFLLEQGYRLRVALDNPANKIQFVDYPGAEIATFDWADPTSISKFLEGMELLFHTVDNGPKLLSHCTTMIAPLKTSKLKYIVKAISGSDQLWSPKFQKYPMMKDSFATEEEIKQVNIPTIIVRPAGLFESFGWWFGDELRKFGSFVTTAKAFTHWIALSDLSECIGTILLSPKKYHEAGDPIHLNSVGLYFEDVAKQLGEGIGKKIHHLAVTDKMVYRECLLRDGFSEYFVDNFILPMHYDFRLEPNETKRFEADVTKLLKRSPLTLKSWASTNIHLFVD